MSDLSDLPLASLRQDYKRAALRRSDVQADPLLQFAKWFAEAQSAQLDEPNALVLGTVGADGQPSTRTVLLKALDDRGFTFFTNYASQKGAELAANPKASMTFLWLPLERQIHLRGSIEKVSAAESDAYFQQRPYKSQIGAIASAQSSVVENREALEAAFAQLMTTYPQGTSVVPRPTTWGGYRLIPHEIEFWQGRQSRLHDRLRYRKQGEAWILERLSP
jgi:pyridoxamine 5'-phosphate oxidase